MTRTPCKDTFDTTVEIVISAAIEKATDGKITVAELKEIQQLLTIDNKDVNAFCSSINQKCMQKYKLDLIVPARTNAYGRIMVQPLERLFNQKNSSVSNKQIPNYFHIIEQILGRHEFEENHDKVAERMRILGLKYGEDFRWEKFADDPDIREIRIRTLATIARSFGNFETRLLWFQEAMEASAEEDKKPGALQFTKRQAKLFLLTLFAEFQDFSKTGTERFKDILSEKEQAAISNLIIELKNMK